MIKVKKNVGKEVKAYRLGSNSDMELNLIAEGKIVKHENGTYEVFSQEAVNGSGEIANAGDYIKVDNAGFPYPNSAEFFEENHVHIGGDVYMQMPKVLDAWTAKEPVSEEIEFLIKHKGLELHPENKEKYFGAFLWRSYLTAAEDAVLVFYDILRNAEGEIVDAEFNFVAAKEFELTYEVVEG